MTRQEPESRAYYVSMIRGKRTALLAGPYDTHAEALANVEPARREASRVDPWSDFDAFGTCSLPREADNPRGVLNNALKVEISVDSPSSRGRYFTAQPDSAARLVASDCGSPAYCQPDSQ